MEAMRLTVEQLQSNHDVALSQWRLEVERTRYEAERIERRYRMVEPEHRLVAHGLKAEWESRLRALDAAEATGALAGPLGVKGPVHKSLALNRDAPVNMQWQTRAEAKAKDKWEWRDCDLRVIKCSPLNG